MKREQFLKEMKTGLWDTLKTVYEPFIEEDLKKLEKTTDRALGIKWLFICNEDENPETISQYFLDGKPIFMIWKEGNMKAISGICPTCSNLLTLSVLYATCKCLNCENHHNFQNNVGDLLLKEFPVTKKNHAYYVGLKG